jgi:hypothetical protein
MSLEQGIAFQGDNPGASVAKMLQGAGEEYCYETSDHACEKPWVLLGIAPHWT